MGLFGSKPKKPKPPPAPSLGAMGKEFQSELFPIIQGGLKGEGLFPDITAQTMRELLGASRETFLEGQRDLPGQLARFIPRADTKVRGFIKSSIDADFFRQNQDIRDEFDNIGDIERQEAQALGFNAVAAERRTATDIASLFNQSQLRRSQAPDFESALLGGLGSAAGFAVGNRDRRSPSIFTNQNTRFGTGLDNPTFGGATRNFPASSFTTPSPIVFAQGFNSIQ